MGSPNYGRRRTDRPIVVVPQPVQEGRFVALRDNAFEAAIAVAALVTAVVFMVNPDDPQAAVSRQLGGWAWMWNVLYALGGFGVLVGLVAHGRKVMVGRFRMAGDGRVELAGMICLTTALIVNFISITQVTWTAPSTTTFAALVFACGARIWKIWRSRRHQVVAVTAEPGR